MNTTIIEHNLKKRFEEAGRHTEGSIETMQEEIDILQNAVAHLMAFIAGHFRLTDDEVDNMNGLTDF